MAVEEPDFLALDAGEAWVLVRPIGDAFTRLRRPDYDILVVPGKQSGYVIEAVLKKDWPVPQRTKLPVMAKDEFRVEYTSVVGDLIAVQHEPVGLRAAATINGTAVDWSRWADGGDGSRQRGAGGREENAQLWDGCGVGIVTSDTQLGRETCYAKVLLVNGRGRAAVGARQRGR